MAMTWELMGQIIGIVTAVSSILGTVFAWYVKSMINDAVNKLKLEFNLQVSQLQQADQKGQTLHDNHVRLETVVMKNEEYNNTRRHDIYGGMQTINMSIQNHELRLVSLESGHVAINSKLDRLLDRAFADIKK